MTLLVLAGTSDARRITAALVERGHDVRASLAGATRTPDPLPVPTSIGGFGGADGFLDFVEEHGIRAVIDATHPFAAQISDRTADICQSRSIPYLHFLRPEWTPEPGDNWTEIASEEDAAQHVAANAVVFLGTGRQTLERFANLAPRRVICRQIDPPTSPFPFDGGEFLIGRPPFPVKSEMRLFARLGVDVLVVKNAGGTLSRTKLDAARAMGIPVLMIRRPPPPDAPRAADLEAVVDWVAAL